MDESKYEYKRFGCDAKRVGQAVVDILSKDNHALITTGEIIELQAEKYRKSLEEAIETGEKIYKNPFYVLVLTNKEFWADNVVRNWFIPRQSCPYASTTHLFSPNHIKTLYLVDTEKGNIKICWSIPGEQDILSILKSPELFHPQLVAWIMDFRAGKLDKESYRFDDIMEDF